MLTLSKSQNLFFKTKKKEKKEKKKEEFKHTFFCQGKKITGFDYF
jgi:hypothetical protein